MRKVLIANRGEIAVRIARACARRRHRQSVAVYADPDRDALHVRVADEAYALGGSTPRRLLPRASTSCSTSPRASGADAVHPGYGFLAENADVRPGRHRRRADLDRPAARRRSTRLGDKVKARHIAEQVGRAARRPAPPTRSRTPTRSSPSPRSTALPVAIKAAFGGGGRGLKVARTHRGDPRAVRVGDPRGGRAPSVAASASSSSTSTSRATSRPSAWPTPTATSSSSRPATARCSAATRSSSRRRPRRSSPTAQNAELYRASKAILREAGYVGAGTCEFLVGQDGTDLLPRGQHPPAGRAPGHRGGHRHRPGPRAVPHRRRRGARLRRPGRRAATRSSSASTARTPAAASCPRPGTVARLRPAVRPRRARRLRRRGRRRDRRRVRLDAGQADRHRRRPAQQALERSRRALAEFDVDGMPTVLPFHRAVVRDPAFAPADGDSRSRCTPAGSRPSSTTPIEPYAGERRATPPRPASASASSSRSAASGSRSSCPPASARPAAAPAARREAGPRASGGAHGRRPRRPATR